MSKYEDGGSGFDSGARGYERAGRQTAPDTVVAIGGAKAQAKAPDVKEAVADFATDPVEAAPVAPAPVAEPIPAASAEATAAPPTEDGRKAAEPEAAPAVAVADPEHYPEAAVDAPSRLSPAARPCRAGP